MTHFYEPSKGHGLPHDPFKAIVAPRPIGWISTVDAAGVPNLAPYSFFNGVCDSPPMVMFSSGGRKHSVANVEATGEFVCNFASHALREAMNLSSALVGPEVNEFELAGLEAAPSRLVRAPRVKVSPAALECKALSVTELKDVHGVATNRFMVIGQVVGVHIEEAYLTEGLFDLAKAGALARCGYLDYASVFETFAMERPKA
ncbi:flavin reductase family protein [Methylopila sp. Yamaguchi]|uniref:flavin reductase family protein n=1 Tax=Methylopila sp. Yamaguchi TaxID=1437817 RepID=UPI000CBB7F4A|nr:flavin reductase family protein [Methylopila sp. Yamaguchi]GBD49012.1 nitrilotriacetate monooxygenase component B [Methylopila sp. Yamaguchi]